MQQERNAFHERNRDKLVAYFASGEKYPRKLGFGLEHILLRKATNAPAFQAPVPRLGRSGESAPLGDGLPNGYQRRVFAN